MYEDSSRQPACSGNCLIVCKWLFAIVPVARPACSHHYSGGSPCFEPGQESKPQRHKQRYSPNSRRPQPDQDAISDSCDDETDPSNSLALTLLSCPDVAYINGSLTHGGYDLVFASIFASSWAAAQSIFTDYRCRRNGHAIVVSQLCGNVSKKARFFWVFLAANLT